VDSYEMTSTITSSSAFFYLVLSPHTFETIVKSH
jgi:hypothetical protein